MLSVITTTGNLLLHQVIVINLSDECPMSDSS